MKIALTGAAGKLGQTVRAELVAAGHSVRAIDRYAGDDILAADLRDTTATERALDGCDAVVQLAAWPTPQSAPPATILADNIAIISNVLFAAKVLGIRRVVAASSQSVLGLPWAEQVILPDYLPVDEAHPCRPADAYSVSKLASEEIAAMFARRGELDIALLRLPAIWDHRQFDASIARRREFPEQGAKSQWAYVDSRDAARAFRLALEVDLAGCQVFNIASAQAFTSEPLEQAIARWYPGLSANFMDTAANAAPFISAKAERLLGFRARFIWKLDGIETLPL